MREELNEAKSSLTVYDSVIHNMRDQIHQLKGNMRVFCRVKPTNQESHISFPLKNKAGSRGVQVHNLELRHPKVGPMSFNFDQVF